MSRRHALAIALLLTACRDRDRAPAEEKPPVAERRAPKRATERTVRPPVLRGDRFGSLDSTSRVDSGALTRAFPGLRVEKARRPAAFDLFRGDDRLFTVVRADDGAVSSVEIVSRAVDTALGARVGDRFEKLQSTAGALECNGGLDDRAKQVLCTPRRARNVTFILETDSDSFAGDDIPAAKLARLVGGRPVRTILWRPPAPGR